MSVHPGDDVAPFDAARRRRAAGAHAAHQRSREPFGKLHHLREMGVEILEIQAEPDRGHLAPGDQLVHHPLRHVDRDREADSRCSPVDRRVDADQLPGGVQQGSPRVSRMDRGVGLEKVVKDAVFGSEGTADRRDHARGDRVREAKGVSNGDDRLPDHQVRGRAGSHPGHLLVGIEPQDGEVVVGVGADQGRLELTAVGEGHANRIRPAHHVLVGEDVPHLVDDDSRAETLGGLGCPGLEVVPEEAVEEGIASEGLEGALPSHHALGGDVHHGRPDRLHHADGRGTTQEWITRPCRSRRDEQRGQGERELTDHESTDVAGGCEIHLRLRSPERSGGESSDPARRPRT